MLPFHAPRSVPTLALVVLILVPTLLLGFSIVSTLFPTPKPASTQPSLRFATEAAFPPWALTNPDGTLAGFEIDLITALCHHLDVVCSVVSLDWTTLIPGLLASRHDAVIAALTITPDRRRRVSFSLPYVAEPSAIAVRANSLEAAALSALPLPGTVDLPPLPAAASSSPDVQPSSALPSPYDLLGKALARSVVGVQSATIQHQLLERALPTVPVRAYDRHADALLDLAFGRLDAVIADRSAIRAFLANTQALGTPLTISGPALRGGPLGDGIAIAFRPDDARRSAIDVALTALSVDGTLSRLSNQWFGHDISLPIPPSTPTP